MRRRPKTTPIRADLHTPDDRLAPTSEAAAAVTPPKRLLPDAGSYLPSAFSLGVAPSERVPMDTSILEQLPVPVLIHAGDALYYANREFLELTGYDTVDELRDAGGLGELFGEPYPPEARRGRARPQASAAHQRRPGISG